MWLISFWPTQPSVCQTQISTVGLLFALRIERRMGSPQEADHRQKGSRKVAFLFSYEYFISQANRFAGSGKQPTMPRGT